MGAPRTTPKVLDALNKRRGQTVTAADLVKATGLTEDQVKTAVLRLIAREGLPITTVSRGSAWRYDADGVNGQTMGPDSLFEVVGQASKGDIIVKGDVTGKLYKVLPL